MGRAAELDGAGAPQTMIRHATLWVMRLADGAWFPACSETRLEWATALGPAALVAAAWPAGAGVVEAMENECAALRALFARTGTEAVATVVYHAAVPADGLGAAPPYSGAVPLS